MVDTTRIRSLNIAKTIDDRVSWLASTIEREEAPGLIVGLSGTDSILSFVFCAMAFNRLKKPLHNLRGVSFQHKTQDKFVEMNKPFVCVESEDTGWVVREIFPWLYKLYPGVRLEADWSITHSKDGARWGSIHDKAKEEVNGRGDLLSGTYYFPVGTRNATEHYIGAHTLITSAVSLFPIIDLFKTEVIDICNFLGVPQIAIDKSQEIDCDCGRFEIQAYYMKELDEEIMLNSRILDIVPADYNSPIRHDVKCFLREEKLLNEFKKRVPYIPQQ